MHGTDAVSRTLITALEDVVSKQVSRVLVCCFDSLGRPIGFLSNETDKLALVGMCESIKREVLELEPEEDEDFESSGIAEA